MTTNIQTVGRLRRLIEGLPDDAEVGVTVTFKVGHELYAEAVKDEQTGRSFLHLEVDLEPPVLACAPRIPIGDEPWVTRVKVKRTWEE